MNLVLNPITGMKAWTNGLVETMLLGQGKLQIEHQTIFFRKKNRTSKVWVALKTVCRYCTLSIRRPSASKNKPQLLHATFTWCQTN